MGAAKYTQIFKENLQTSAKQLKIGFRFPLQYDNTHNTLPVAS